ncbi:MAG: recombination protein RecR, partial [Cyanobacteria bacterium REEB65]|nr:recombination protein RecR [Cyanobacteria bacterium REEB65]
MLYTRSLQTLIAELQKLPGVGPKSAQRLAFHLLRQPAAEVQKLATALVEAKERIRTCSRCCNLSEADPCELCLASRDDALLCLVAEPKDLVALERTREYRGRYHVLG